MPDPLDFLTNLVAEMFPQGVVRFGSAPGTASPPTNLPPSHPESPLHELTGPLFSGLPMPVGAGTAPAAWLRSAASSGVRATAGDVARSLLAELIEGPSWLRTVATMPVSAAHRAAEPETLLPSGLPWEATSQPGGGATSFGPTIAAQYPQMNEDGSVSEVIQYSDGSYDEKIVQAPEGATYLYPQMNPDGQVVEVYQLPTGEFFEKPVS